MGSEMHGKGTTLVGGSFTLTPDLSLEGRGENRIGYICSTAFMGMGAVFFEGLLERMMGKIEIYC